MRIVEGHVIVANARRNSVMSLHKIFGPGANGEAYGSFPGNNFAVFSNYRAALRGARVLEKKIASSELERIALHELKLRIAESPSELELIKAPIVGIGFYYPDEGHGSDPRLYGPANESSFSRDGVADLCYNRLTPFAEHSKLTKSMIANIARQDSAGCTIAQWYLSPAIKVTREQLGLSLDSGVSKQ